jgi:hypothetical protein
MIRTTVDAASRTRLTTVEGEVGDADMLEAVRLLVGDPGYDPALDHLLDLRGVRRLDVSAAAIQQMARTFAQFDPLRLPNRLAIVAPADDTYGVARMYELLRSDATGETRVFRDMAEAQRWLGLARG